METSASPTMQDLYLEILRRSRCNALDGERVYADLLAHRALWHAAYPVRTAGGDGVTLRDLQTDAHDCDTLYLSTDAAHYETLARLAESWDADEVDRDKEAEMFGNAERVLRVWWD